ncbi:MAG: hypothetical protein ABL958_07080 [Bdellovibrionia bacterium]
MPRLYGFAIAIVLFSSWAGAQVVPEPNSPVTPAREKALTIYKRLNGISTPIDSPILKQMEPLVASGDLKGAARLATAERGFLNVVVKDFAAKMSTREETVAAPLSDFVATLVGVTRDGIDARQLLVGNFTYRGIAGLANVRAAEVADILSSNNHYADIESQGLDLRTSIARSDVQKLVNTAGAAVDNPEPAGVVTSRAFMEAHAAAGTNRRIIEYVFREFMCVPMTEFADATGSDSMIGRDVDRFPGGSNEKFQVTCKACHSNHDPLRPAVARFDFADGIVKHALVLPNGGGANQMRQNPVGISSKMNQNNTVFPEGYAVNDSTWVNQANRGANIEFFGWRGWQTGNGVNQFGSMISSAEGFSRCMAKRVYQSVCKRDPAAFENPMIRQAAVGFEASNYNLRSLFEEIASRTECLGN